MDRVGFCKFICYCFVSCRFKCNDQTKGLILELRSALNKVLEELVRHPRPIDWGSDQGRLLRIIIDFLSLEDLNEYEAEANNAGSGDEDEDN